MPKSNSLGVTSHSAELRNIDVRPTGTLPVFVEEQPLPITKPIRRFVYWSRMSCMTILSFLSFMAIGTLMSAFSLVSIASVASATSVLSAASVNSVLSVASVNSILSIGCVGEYMKICFDL